MPPRWNPKWIGEQGECAFLDAAMSRGFLVSKPFGDSARYDFIVDPTGPDGGRGPLWRVQVKSALTRSGTRSPYPGYVISVRHGTPPKICGFEDADFLAAYIFDYHAWYIIPMTATTGAGSLWLYPNRKTRGMFERFREAWHLLRSSRLLTLRRND